LTVTYKDVAAATHAAGPARTTGEATGRAGAKGPVAGALDGDLTGSGVVNATLFTGSVRADVEILWRDKTVYVRRAATTAAASAGLAAWMLRPPTQRAWTKGSLESQYASYLFSPFAPAALADLLAMRRIPVAVTHDGSQRKMHATKPLGILGPWFKATVDLWVDGANRVTRVQISSDAGGMSYDVKYGGSAPAVTAPPANQIQPTEAKNPEPAGSYVTVQSGNTDGVTWALQRAKSTVAGYECWRWQSTPTIAIVAADAHGNRCIPVIDPTDDPSNQAVFVASSNGKGKFDLLAIRLPVNARSVAVSPIGGQATTAPASGDAFVWVGPVADKAGFAVVTLADGTRLLCGPGSITLPSDWSSVDATKKAQLMASPWACTTP
jgi:hypothetical protein